MGLLRSMKFFLPRNRQPKSLTEHLAIDEYKSVKSVTAAMSCILMDNYKHTVVDVLENRTQAYLTNYFTRFSRAERLKVKTITMDMNGAFKNFLPRLFPNVIVIVDRFHIVQLMTKALNQYRVQVMNKLKSRRYRRDANKFKHY